MKMKQYSLLFLGGGFCPTGSWKRSPRKGRGCLQIPPPTKREERLAPPFWPQCSWTRPKEKRWNCLTWRMSVFSPQPWCTSCICKASYNLWSLWSLWVLPYSMIQIFCHISWKSSFHFYGISFALFKWASTGEICTPVLYPFCAAKLYH